MRIDWSCVVVADPVRLEWSAVNGLSRAEYWFGRRDWSVADHWEGPGSLWAGMQYVTGGPNDGGSYDKAAWDGLQETNYRVYQAINRNFSYNTKALNDRGAAAVAGAIVGQLGTLSVYPVTKADTETKVGQGYRMFDGTERVLAPVDVDMLNGVLKVATQHAGGVQTLDAGMKAYRTYLTGKMVDGTITDTYQATGSLFRFQAAVDGAALRGRLDQAQLHDSVINARIQALGAPFNLATSAIPIPLLSAAAGNLITGTQTGASHLFADNYRDQLQAHKDNEGKQIAIVQGDMTDYLKNLERLGLRSNLSEPMEDWPYDFLASYRDAFGNNAGVLTK